MAQRFEFSHRSDESRFFDANENEQASWQFRRGAQRLLSWWKHKLKSKELLRSCSELLQLSIFSQESTVGWLAKFQSSIN